MATVTRYDPIRDGVSVHSEVERLVRQVVGNQSTAAPAGAFRPALDVEETDDGLLTVTVPKAEEAKPRRIEVRAA